MSSWLERAALRRRARSLRVRVYSPLRVSRGRGTTGEALEDDAGVFSRVPEPGVHSPAETGDPLGPLH
jgi:hypothetical protein